MTLPRSPQASLQPRISPSSLNVTVGEPRDKPSNAQSRPEVWRHTPDHRLICTAASGGVEEHRVDEDRADGGRGGVADVATSAADGAGRVSDAVLPRDERRTRSRAAACSPRAGPRAMVGGEAVQRHRAGLRTPDAILGIGTARANAKKRISYSTFTALLASTVMFGAAYPAGTLRWLRTGREMRTRHPG